MFGHLILKNRPYRGRDGQYARSILEKMPLLRTKV